MPRLHSLAATVVASTALCLAAAPALASPMTVNLRVEGKTQTLYEGPITTDAKTRGANAPAIHVTSVKARHRKT